MTQKLEEPNKAQVTLTLDVNLIETVDNIRGRKSRSAFINDCIAYNFSSDNIPYTKEDLEHMYREHLENMKKINPQPRRNINVH